MRADTFPSSTAVPIDWKWEQLCGRGVGLGGLWLFLVLCLGVITIVLFFFSSFFSFALFSSTFSIPDKTIPDKYLFR